MLIRETTRTPWWLTAIVILGALLMGAGAVIALVNPSLLVSPNDEINAAVHIYAGYLVSRNLALAVGLLAMLAIRARQALGAILVVTAAVQIFDAALDAFEGRWPLVPGVLILGLAFLVCASRSFGRPWWTSAAWKDNTPI